MRAHAKINLALVVGPLRADGKHEVATVLMRIGLADELTLRPAEELDVEGYTDDTIVRAALTALAAAANVSPAWRVTLDKQIPVAAGLGGGSSDAAAALALANATLADPLPARRLHQVAAAVGADVPFFLAQGPQLGTGDGSTLEPVDLALDFVVCLVLPHGAVKESTGAVYARFTGAAGFQARRAELLDALEADDLQALPANDLLSSPLAERLVELGAFRADVSGAGPTVYGLFTDRRRAERAAAELAPLGRAFVVEPAW